MPEAAEVAVLAAQLGRVAIGRELRSVTVTHPRTMRAAVPGAFEPFSGGVVTDVRRHGKWLLVSVDHGPVLGVHLRMSGQLLAREPGEQPVDRHVHALVALAARPRGLRRSADTSGTSDTSGPSGTSSTSGTSIHVGTPVVPAPPRDAPGTSAGAVAVWFRDPRTFGELRVLPGGAPVAADLFDPSVDADVLAGAARRRRVGVKAVLLDQTRTVSGIGSYLADEALHRAGISPLRPADSLAPTAWERILAAARAVAGESAAAGGVTLPDEGWIDLWGRPGRYAGTLRVHGRDRCASCRSATRRATVGGRSARWCPRCQDARRRH